MLSLIKYLLRTQLHPPQFHPLHRHPCQLKSLSAELLSLIDNVFSNQAGESARENNLPTIDISDGIPLGAGISQKTKQNIWDKEFIDLKSLLPNQFDDPVSVTIAAGSINFQHDSKPKSLLTITSGLMLSSYSSASIYKNIP